jgi:hypothetical protein
MVIAIFIKEYLGENYRMVLPTPVERNNHCMQIAGHVGQNAAGL